jgi:hypothetical protein
VPCAERWIERPMLAKPWDVLGFAARPAALRTTVQRTLPYA